MSRYSTRPIIPVEVRFSTKYLINEVTNCWEWTKATNNIGYGMFRFDSNGMRTAHRVSYELYNGPIPKGMIVCHTCDNPKCVNPDHLWLGTQLDNYLDMVSKGRNKALVKGSKMPLKTCIHCGVTRPANIIGKVHNDKCKNKLGSINTISTGMQSP